MGSCLDGGDVLCNDVSRVGSRMQESPLKAAQKRNFRGMHEIFKRAPKFNCRVFFFYFVTRIPHTHTWYTGLKFLWVFNFMTETDPRKITKFSTP